MTSALLQWMLQTSIIALVLIPIVVALSRTVLRNRPAAQHALWTVLLLKCITPAIVVWPWALPDVRGVVGGMWARWNGESNAGTAAAHDMDVASADPAMFAAPAAHGTLITLDTIVVALLLLWIVGCAALAARSAYRIALQARALSGGTSATPSLARTIAQVAGRMNLLPLPAIIVRGIRSPFVWCLGRLRLAWPEGMAGEIGARAGEHDLGSRSLSVARPIIAHELAHIRRRDHWLAWIELVASIIWWWNPLFWIVQRNLRATSEMACDALALAAYPDERCAYAETLLTLSALPSTRAPALGLAATTGTRHSFERRMSMIVSERVTGRHTRPTLLLAGLLAVVSIPAWSFNQTQAEEVSKVQAKRAAAADKAKRAEIEQELLAHMAMLDEKQAILQEHARGEASPEALKELQDARDMLQAKIEALQVDGLLRKYVEADAATHEKRKVDLHQRLAALELKRAALLEKTAGNPDPADLASLEEARVYLIEKMHADMATFDADAKSQYKARTKKPPPLDAETVKRQAVKELLDAMLHPAGKKYRAADEAAAADKAKMMSDEAHKELLHRYLLDIDKKKRVEEAGTDDAAAEAKEMLHRRLMELGGHAEAKALLADEAAAADADVIKMRHMEMLKSYKKALAEEAAAAGKTLTDADRAKLKAHARMLKEELARKAEADANAKNATPKN